MKKTITFRPADDTKSLMEKALKISGMSQSSLINQAIRNHLKDIAGKRIEVGPINSLFLPRKGRSLPAEQKTSL